MSERTGMTVSELNLLVAEAVRKEPRIRSVAVCGEVSGFRHYMNSGHWYFSLKDEDSSVSCVMFRQNTFQARIRPKDGDRVIVTGYVDVYPKNGTYQLHALGLRPDGTGDLFLRFEELKRRLNAEGLFDPSRKRMLPMKPRKVAVVTSASGAAWHDILNVSALRCPSVPIVLIPATVQGEKAPAEIAAGIRAACDRTDADVLIVARGGGSTEDLWCFNDEGIARAVAGSRIPVVSGVGHEIDTTICDLAADVRASTPSNAAEIVFPDRKELRGRVGTLQTGLLRAAENVTARAEIKVREAFFRLTYLSPEKRITRMENNSMLRRAELVRAMQVRIEEAEKNIAQGKNKLCNAASKRIQEAEIRLAGLREQTEAMNPMRVLERGYALVTDRDGHTVTRPADAEKAGLIRIRFSGGMVDADVRKGETCYDGRDGNG